MGDKEEQVNILCHYNHIEAIQETTIVESLETFLGKINNLIQLFKQTSTNKNAKRLNASTTNEVSIVMVGDQFKN